MIFEIVKIRNGWNIKCSWIEPGGAGYPPEPRMETLYCREINEIANVLVEWVNKGFEAAFKTLQEILNLKEAKGCQKDKH